MNQSKKEISVIIPCYNVSKWIQKLIYSLLSQSFIENIEIICVDDGSSDGTSEILDDFASRYGFIKVIHQCNGGLANARNTGLNQAVGEYVWFVDADDMINANSFSVLMKEIASEPSDVICFNFQEIDMEDNVINDVRNYHYNYNETTTGGLAYSLNSIPSYVWNRIIKREIIESNNLRFCIYPEDEDFSIHTYFLSKSFRFIPNVLYKYRAMDESLGKYKESYVKFFWGYFKIMDKYLNMYNDNRDVDLWSAILYTCMINIFTTYNRARIADSKSIEISRKQLYHSIREYANKYKSRIGYNGRNGILLWVMIHLPIIVDCAVYFRYKTK